MLAVIDSKAYSRPKTFNACNDAGSVHSAIVAKNVFTRYSFTCSYKSRRAITIKNKQSAIENPIVYH